MRTALVADIRRWSATPQIHIPVAMVVIGLDWRNVNFTFSCNAHV